MLYSRDEPIRSCAGEIKSPGERPLNGRYGTWTQGPKANLEKFRNEVVHKGFLPTAATVAAYGESAYVHIGELLSNLRQRYPEELKYVLLQTIQQ